MTWGTYGRSAVPKVWVMASTNGLNSVNRKKDNFFITRAMTASSVDEHVWVATRPCILVNVREIHSVVGSTSAAVRPRKITDTSAPGAAASATVVEVAASIDLTATINTVVTPTLTASRTARRFKANDKLAHDYSGTLTNLVGVVTYEFEPV